MFRVVVDRPDWLRWKQQIYQFDDGDWSFQRDGHFEWHELGRCKHWFGYGRLWCDGHDIRNQQFGKHRRRNLERHIERHPGRDSERNLCILRHLH